MKLTDKIEIFKEDCMLGMKRYPDKHFDLAICDPPYGIGIARKNKLGSPTAFGGTKGHKGSVSTQKINPRSYGVKDWDDKVPEKEYFSELLRVSKKQIIWGANHFISKIPFDSPCWIVWDKVNGENNFADCELAWTSFETAVRKVKWKWHGMLQQDMKNKEERIHPTQKPVKLYQWLLENYAKPEYKILDTHLGSNSIGIACHYFGCEMVGFEIDDEYFENAEHRFKENTKRLSLM